MRLKGRVALVTGVSSGIGNGTAIRFAEEGADLVITEFRHPVNEVIGAAKKCGRRVLSVKVDMRSAKDITNLVDRAMETFGRIDILFCNAGIVSWARCEDITDDEWDYVVDCDLKGTFRLCRAVVPIMKEQGYGRIITNSSISGGTVGWPGRSHYCAAKAGTEGFVRALALEVAPFGVTVNSIAPGTIESMMTRGRASHGAQALKTINKLIPVGFVGQPEDVAGLATYLASEEARFLTGQAIVIDGGFSIGPVVTVPDENPPPKPGEVAK